MARFAPVVPLAIARQLQGKYPNKDLLGNYHLLLAHDILKHPKEYQQVYGEVRRRYGKDSFIILDNSIVELGKAMSIDDLMAASDILRPDCIVVPDVMGDGSATRLAAERFCREYAKRMVAAGDPNNIPSLLGVIQGDSVADCMDTASLFYVQNLIEYVSVPRIVGQKLGTRMGVLNQLAMSPRFAGIHLLGFSDNLLDDVACARHPLVQGIDSAVPIRAGLRGQEITIEYAVDYGPRGLFWDTTEVQYNLNHEQVRANIEAFRRWITV